MLELEIGLLIVLISLSAFFSSVETALMSVGSIKVRALVKQKKRGSEALQRLKANPQRLLITILVGNNLVNIGAAALATSITTEMFGNIGIGIATGVMTLLILVFGEITPKSYAAQHSARMSLRVARPIEILGKILFPITRSLEALTGLLMKRFGSGKAESLTEEELKTIVTMGAEQGIIRKQVAGMMESLIEFEKTEANEVMTPKSDMLTIDGSRTIKDVLDFVVKTPYSRYPVYTKDSENITGIVDVDEILLMVKTGKTGKRVSSIAKKPFFVPEKKEIVSLLSDFEKKGTSMAIVVDEYGHVLGLVTMDDVLEEVVGDIFDKSRKPSMYIKMLKPDEFLVDGRAPVNIIEDYVDLGLKEKSSDTIAGLILRKTGRIPQKGEVLRLGNSRLVIAESSPRTIKRVRILKRLHVGEKQHSAKT
jgi:putative hemolysin